MTSIVAKKRLVMTVVAGVNKNIGIVRYYFPNLIKKTGNGSHNERHIKDDNTF